MSAGDYAVLTAVAAGVFFAIRAMRRAKKKGKCIGCGGSCAGCGNCAKKH